MSAAIQAAAPPAFDPGNVTVPADKVRKYLLNLSHPDGGPKAKFFISRGFSEADWQILACALELHPIENNVQSTEANAFGAKFLVRCKLRTPDGRNPCVLTVWMIDGPGAARFVTAYPS